MEEKTNMKILVAVHKSDTVYSDNIYMPIHVGKAISKLDLGFQGDNTGENISEKNPIYCELTAQYWAWKNLKDVNYIGLCHYRRYFKTKYTKKTLESLFHKYDIILPRPIYRSFPMEQKLYRAAIEEDVAIFYQVIEKLYPEYKNAVLTYMHGNKDVAFNMFVCSKELFDQYAEWQFSILFECEKYIRFSGYSRARRLLGHFSEYLLPIYCFHHQLRVKSEELVSFVGNNELLYSQSFIKKIVNNIRYRLTSPRKKTDWELPLGILQGLRNDGIEI